VCALRPNENKMSDGERERASLGVNVWKSSQKWSAQRSAVRSIAWLGLFGGCGSRISMMSDNVKCADGLKCEVGIICVNKGNEAFTEK
jgi:hypothetical protein